MLMTVSVFLIVPKKFSLCFVSTWLQVCLVLPSNFGCPVKETTLGQSDFQRALKGNIVTTEENAFLAD